MNWIAVHGIEILGTLLGLLYVYLEIKERIWLWPIGLATAALYIIVFFTAKLYADMALQFYYVAICAYGWYHWTRNSDSTTQLRIQSTPFKTAWFVSIVTIILYFALAYILKTFTDSDVPKLDAFTTALSVTGTWMLAQKYIQHWYVWIIVNIVSSALYIYKGLYFTTGLYTVYLILSFVGLVNWKKKTTAYH